MKPVAGSPRVFERPSLSPNAIARQTLAETAIVGDSGHGVSLQATLPVGVPSTLPQLKGMPRTPSTGILSALAVAERMARGSGELSVKELDIVATARHAPSENTAHHQLEDAVVSPPCEAGVEPPQCATTFAVQSKPLFAGEGENRAFLAEKHLYYPYKGIYHD